MIYRISCDLETRSYVWSSDNEELKTASQVSRANSDRSSYKCPISGWRQDCDT